MFLIFTASGDTGNFQRSSRILGPVLRWLFPSIHEYTVLAIVFTFRKCAHVTEYGILALFVWFGRAKSGAGAPVNWGWRSGAEALWVAALYATTDEFHQTFIPSREGCVRDVLVDVAGAAAALLLVILAGRRRTVSRQ